MISDTFVSALVTQSLTGAGLILLMLTLRKLLSGKVRHTLIYGLWLVVALRMLIPLSLPNPIHFDRKTDIPAQVAYIVQKDDAVTQSQNDDTGLVQSKSDAQAAVQAAHPQMQDAVSQSTSSTQPTQAGGRTLPMAQWLTAVWLLGVALSAAYMLLVNHRFVRRIFAEAVALPVTSPVPVYLADVPSPCLVGVLRPRIALNAVSARPENLPFALAHEQCHYRGWDHVWNLLRNILLAVFWFHPLVWLAAHCSRQDCERACDERTIRTLTRGDTIEYARTLIALVSPRKAIFSAPANFMATSLPDMKKRVTLIITRRRIQRWACALFTMLMLLSSAVSFATGKVVVQEITLPEKYQETPLYYPTAGGLWVVLGGQLYRQSGEATFAEVATAPSASQIAADDAAVYVLDGEKKKIQMLDHQGVHIKEWALPAELAPFKIESAGDRLALLSGQPADMADGRLTADARFYLLDKQNGALKEVKLGTVIDVCADGKGGLIVLHVPLPGTYEAVVSRINPHTSAVSTITTTDYQAMGIAAEPGLIYILTLGGLSQYSEASATGTRIEMPEGCTPDSLTSIRASGSTLYCWDVSSRRLLTIDVSDDRSAGKTIITVVNNDGVRDVFDVALKGFLVRHPDVEVRDVSMSPDQYKTALLAGDAGIDILYEHSGVMWELAEAGALVPLSNEPSIMNALSLAEWLPFEEVYSTGGKLYGIPCYVMYDMWKVNEELSQQIGYQMPAYPYTWQDVYVAADAAGLGQPGKPVLMYNYRDMPEVLTGYTRTQAQKQGALKFDTPGFRADMEAYQQMVERGIIVLYDGGEPPKSPPAIIETSAEISDQTVQTPTVNGMEVALMQSYGYFVSAMSPNRELAIELLAEFIRPENQYQADYGIPGIMLLKDIEPYSRIHYDDPDYYIPRYTSKKEELRQFAAGKWVTWSFKLHPIHILKQTNVLPRYLAGEISIDEFIRVIQSKADMMQYE